MKVNKLVSMQRGRGGKKGGKGGNSERCGTGSRAALDRVDMILNTLRVRYCPVVDTSEGGERGQHEPVPLIGKIGHQRAQDRPPACQSARTPARALLREDPSCGPGSQGGRADFSLPVGQFGAVVDDADDASFGRSYARISLMERHSDMLV